MEHVVVLAARGVVRVHRTRLVSERIVGEPHELDYRLLLGGPLNVILDL